MFFNESFNERCILELYKSKYIEMDIDEPYVKQDYVTFLMKIKAYRFYGEHSFCMHFNNLIELTHRLSQLYNEMSGEVRFNDYDSESFICLRFIENNYVSITGQLGSEWEDNVWTFKYNVDQTIINLLINSFNELKQLFTKN